MATVVIGFVVGFALGGRAADVDDVSASGPPPSSTSTSSTAPDRSTTSTTGADASTSTSSTTTTAPPDTSTTRAVATTLEPTTTTTVVPFPTIPTTLAPVTTAAPPVAPSRVVVSHSSDAQGRLVIPRGGSASLAISNEGGLAQQWLVTGTGFVTAGATQGSLGPGQYVTVTLLPPPGELPTGEINGIVSVLGAINPTVAFVIPPA